MKRTISINFDKDNYLEHVVYLDDKEIKEIDGGSIKDLLMKLLVLHSDRYAAIIWEENGQRVDLLESVKNLKEKDNAL